MKVYKKVAGPVGANCFVLETDKKNAIVVDPGDEGEVLVPWIKEELGLTVVAVLLTHGHFDHIGATDAFTDAFPEAEVFYNYADRPVVEWSRQMMPNKRAADVVLDGSHVEDGQVLTFDNLEIQVMYTPGHSVGSVVYLVDDKMFSGDTIFRREIGRCDLITGDYEVMLQTLKKIADLEGDYKIYTGHMENTTLDYERSNNPYMRKVL